MRRNERVAGIVLTASVFAAGILIALSFVERLELPFRNPWDIRGVLTELRYNPLNNTLRFLLVVLLPSALLAAGSLHGKLRRRLLGGSAAPPAPPAGRPPLPAGPLRRAWMTAAAVLFAVIVALNVPTYHSSGAFDPFHEGESLGPAVSVLSGKLPYRDVLFLHGAFQDPLRSVLAFRLLNRSIGSVRTVESVMKVLSFLTLFLFLLLLVRESALEAWAAFLALLYLMCLFWLILPPRDVTSWTWLIVLTLLARAVAGGRTLPRTSAAALFFLLFFIPPAAFAYSIDRGFYLSAVLVFAGPAALLPFLKRNPGGTAPAASLAGASAAVLFLWLVFQGQLAEFFRFTFLVLPKYKELMDGAVFPFGEPSFLAFVLLAALNLYGMTRILLRAVFSAETVPAGLARFFRENLPEISLLLLSVFFFRSALGRADWEHVIYSAAPALILAFRLFFRYGANALPGRREGMRAVLAALVVLGVIAVSGVSLFRIAAGDVLAENFPFRREDRSFVPLHHVRTLSYLGERLGAGEHFYTMTSEGSWYYFTGRPCPSRFLLPWTALPPFCQEEVARDLETRRVRYILYRSDSWSFRIDGIPVIDRLPILDGYIRDHYRFDVTIDGNELWVRKNGHPGGAPGHRSNTGD